MSGSEKGRILSGEGNVLMATNPHDGGESYRTNSAWQAGNFNEWMSGFEPQAVFYLMAT